MSYRRRLPSKGAPRSARAIVSKPQFDQLVKRIERLEKKLGKK